MSASLAASEAAAALGRKGWESLTPQEREERLRPAREAKRKNALDRWVQTVVERAPELSQEQRDTIATALASVGDRR